MKSVLITFDQTYYERIIALLDRLGCRGFTYLERVQGRGSKTGDLRKPCLAKYVFGHLVGS